MFLKLLLLFFLPSIIYGNDYFFYVNSPEEVDSYHNIFQAFASIFNEGSYLGLLKIVFLFGGFFVFVKGILDSFSGGSPEEGMKNYTKYSVSIVILLSVVFSFNATVYIKTNNIPSYCSHDTSVNISTAIDNVPEILAYSFTTINRISRALTSLIETAFIIPSGNGSTSLLDNHGYLGPIKSSMQLMTVNLSQVTLANNFSGNPVDLGSLTRILFTECILIPFSSKGDEGLSELNKMKVSKDLKLYLDDLYLSNRVIGGIAARDYTADFQGTTMSCGTLYDYMQQGFNQFDQNASCSFPGVTAGAVQIITGEINPPESSFKQVTLQAGLISELEYSQRDIGSSVSGIGYNNGKSKADFLQTQIAAGQFNAEMLPFLQSIIRGIIYAFFPFSFVIMILPGGFGVLSQYFKSIVWIELWTPTAAILNMFLNNQAQYEMSNLYTKQGMTLMNSVNLLNSGSTIAGIAGYLYASVPALTWMIVSGSGSMLSSLGHGIAEFAAKHVQSDAVLKDTTDLSQKNELKRNNVKNPKTGEDFSLAEMEHYQAVQSGAVAGATFGTQVSAGMDAVKGFAALKEARSLASFKQLQAGSVISGVGSDAASTLKAAGELENKNTLTTLANSQAFKSLSPEVQKSLKDFNSNEIIGTSVSKATANDKGYGQAEARALQEAKHAKGAAALSELKANLSTHQPQLAEIEKSIGRKLTDNEKAFYVMARKGDAEGAVNFLKQAEAENYSDLVTGKANHIDQTTGKRDYSTEDFKQLFGRAADKSHVSDRSDRVNIQTEKELRDFMSPESQGHGNAIQTVESVAGANARADAGRIATGGKSDLQAIKNQASVANMKAITTSGGMKTELFFNKKGGIVSKKSAEGHTYSGAGSRFIMESISSSAESVGLAKDKVEAKKLAEEINHALHTIQDVMSFVNPFIKATAMLHAVTESTKKAYTSTKDTLNEKKVNEETKKAMTKKFEDAKIQNSHLEHQKHAMQVSFNEEKEKLANDRKKATENIEARRIIAEQEDAKAREKFLYEKSEVEKLQQRISIHEKNGFDTTDMKNALQKMEEDLERTRISANINRVESVDKLAEHNEKFFNQRETELLAKEQAQLKEINSQIEENKKIMEENRSLEEKLKEENERFQKEQADLKKFAQLEAVKNQKIKEIDQLKAEINKLSGQEKIAAEEKLKVLEKILNDISGEQMKFAYKADDALKLANDRISSLENQREFTLRKIDAINNSKKVFVNGEKVSIEKAKGEVSSYKEAAEKKLSDAEKLKEISSKKVNNEISNLKEQSEGLKAKSSEIQGRLNEAINNTNIASEKINELVHKLEEDSTKNSEKMRELSAKLHQENDPEKIKSLQNDYDRLNEKQLFLHDKINDIENRNFKSELISYKEKAALIDESKAQKEQRNINKEQKDVLKENSFIEKQIDTLEKGYGNAKILTDEQKALFDESNKAKKLEYEAASLNEKADKLEAKIEKTELKFAEKEAELKYLEEQERKLNQELSELRSMDDSEKIKQFQEEAINNSAEKDLKDIDRQLNEESKNERALTEEKIAKKEKVTLTPRERQHLKDIKDNERKINDLNNEVTKLKDELAQISSKGVSSDGTLSSKDVEKLKTDIKILNEDIQKTQVKLNDLNIQKMDIDNQLRDSKQKMVSFEGELKDSVRVKEAIADTFKKEKFDLEKTKEAIAKEMEKGDDSRSKELNDINKRLEEINKFELEAKQAKESLEKFNEDKMSNSEYRKLAENNDYLEFKSKEIAHNIDSAKSEISSLNDKLDSKNEKGFSSQSEKDKAEKDLKSKISKKEAELNKLSKTTDTMKNSKIDRMISSRTDKLDNNLKDQITKKESLSEDLKDNLERQKTFGEDLNKNINKLESDLIKKSEEIDLIKDKINDLHKENMSDYEIEKLKQLQVELETKSKELEISSEKLEHLKEEKVLFDKDPDSSNDFKSLKEEQVSLEKEIDKTNTKIGKINSKIETTGFISKEGRASRKMDNVNSLSNDVFTDTKEKIKEERIVDELKSDIKDETQKLDELKKDFETIEKSDEFRSFEEKEKAMTDKLNEIETQKNKINGINEEIKEHNKKINDLEKSIKKTNGKFSSEKAKVRNISSNKAEGLTPRQMEIADMKTTEKQMSQDLYQSKSEARELEKQLEKEYTRKGVEIPDAEKERLNDLKLDIATKEEILEETKRTNTAKREKLAKENKGTTKQKEKAKKVDKDMKGDFKESSKRTSILKATASSIEKAQENRKTVSQTTTKVQKVVKTVTGKPTTQVKADKQAAKTSHKAKVNAIKSQHATTVAKTKRAVAKAMEEKETGFFERLWNKTNIDTNKVKNVFKGGLAGVAVAGVEYVSSKLNTAEGKAVTSLATAAGAPFMVVIDLGVSAVKSNFYAAGFAYASATGNEKLKQETIKELDVLGKEFTSLKAFDKGADMLVKARDLAVESKKLADEGKWTTMSDLKKAGGEVMDDLHKVAQVTSTVASAAYDHMTVENMQKAANATIKFASSDHANPWSAAIAVKEKTNEVKEKLKTDEGRIEVAMEANSKLNNNPEVKKKAEEIIRNS